MESGRDSLRRRVGAARFWVLGLALPLMLSGCGGARAYQVGVKDEPTPAHTIIDNYGRIRLPVGGRVLALGDDLIGHPADLPGAKLPTPKRAPKEAEPYTARLQAALGPGVTVIAHTSPGARIDQALAEFPSLPHADAVILVFGPGDLWGTTTPTPFPQFSESYRALIALAQANGSYVIVVAPPPVSSPTLNAGLADIYREVARERAHMAGADLYEPKAAFAEVRRVWSDGVHLTTSGSHALGNILAGYFIPPKS